MSKKTEPVYASDGLLARANGDYAREKLDWLEHYLRAGLAIASAKLDRVYVDLFAGPGLSIGKQSGEEFESGALRAVQMVGSDKAGSTFTRAFLVNLDADQHAALTERIDRLAAAGKLRIPRPNIHLLHGDANVRIHEIVEAIHPRAWMFVFADIEAPRQLPFSTIDRLKRDGHTSVDLYALFPLQMGLNRIFGYEVDIAKSAPILDEYFGTRDWRPLFERRQTDAQSAEFRRELEELYCAQLRTLWREADRVTQIRFTGQRVLYHMLFAASNDAALRLANSLSARAERLRNPEQPELF